MLNSAVTVFGQPTSAGFGRFSHKNRGFGSVSFLAVCQHLLNLNNASYATHCLTNKASVLHKNEMKKMKNKIIRNEVKPQTIHICLWVTMNKI